MRHARSLDFDALESRKLLSSRVHHAVAHHAPAHPAAAAVSVPVTLNGTLTLDSKATSTSMDAQSDMTTTIPVAGTLGALGQVHGVWNESVDANGNYLGPDTLQLHGARGGGRRVQQRGPRESPPDRDRDRLFRAQPEGRRRHGAYARATESGTIDVNMNAAKSHVVSLTLNTTTT